jgi:ribonuclease HI
MVMKLILFTDGGARGNPGPAGIGAVIMNQDKKVIKTIKKYIGEATNNQAEYEAIKAGLTEALKMNPHEIECFLDSELVVQQLNGKYKVKDKELQQLCGQVQDMIFMKFVTFRHIPREQNTLADKLVNEALDEALWKYNN